MQIKQPILYHRPDLEENSLDSVRKWDYGTIVQCKPLKDDEETTKIVKLTCLEVSPLKCFVIVPILSLLTCFFILLFIHWYPNIKRKFFYKNSNLKNASHLFIEGSCKSSNFIIYFIVNHKEIIQLNKMYNQDNQVTEYVYIIQ